MSVTLLTQAYFIYSIPLLIALFLCVLEGLFMARGISLLGILKTPDSPQSEQIDTSADHAIATILGVHEISSICWLLVFFITFGVSGISAQLLHFTYTNSYLSHFLLCPIAAVTSVTATVAIIKLMAMRFDMYAHQQIPIDFTGYIATIESYGEFLGDTVKASVLDHNNLLKTITVTALENTQRFVSGDKVVLVKYQQGNWLATRLQEPSAKLVTVPAMTGDKVKRIMAPKADQLR